MNLAPVCLRRLIVLTLLSSMSGVFSAHAGDRVPLVGTGPQAPGLHVSAAKSESGQIVSVDPNQVPCPLMLTFAGVDGGPTPGTNYDDVLSVGDLSFAEHFVGQSVSSSGDFDVVSGTPSQPLQLETGAAGQNLDVFDYQGNVLAGLGPLGYKDIDAIGEGAIAIYFPAAQAMVSFSLLGGNGGSASLRFYRQDGTLIDQVVVTDLGDLTYGFETLDGSYSIAGILIQNTDVSGIALNNICYDPQMPTSARPTTWGSLKQLYR
jgi:hypothetical protein